MRNISDFTSLLLFQLIVTEFFFLYTYCLLPSSLPYTLIRSKKGCFWKTLLKPEKFVNTGQLECACTENILKTEFFENIAIITWFPWPSFPQTQIQNHQGMMLFQIFSGVMWKASNIRSSGHANCVLTYFVLLFLNLSLKHLLSRTNSSKPILKTKPWTGFLIYLQNNKTREYFFLYKLWSLYNLEFQFVITCLPKTLDIWSVIFFSSKRLVLDRGIVAFVCLCNQQHVELL